MISAVVYEKHGAGWTEYCSPQRESQEKLNITM